MDNPAILLRRLNPYSARAMEGAASLCQTRSHADNRLRHQPGRKAAPHLPGK
ncbi:hypothetical protein NUKP104_21330 [Klebsiella variicola]|nr:hypothetical protein [Klebsiella variicola]GKO24923.1 hypothetical protein NUKP104_21330 [Klebsiella variicola]